MKLWALLEALQPLDPSADVEIALRDSATQDFEVLGVIASHSVTLAIDPDTLALPGDPKMEALEAKLDDMELDLDKLKEATRVLVRNLKESKEGALTAERTALLNETIEEVEDLL